MTDPTPPPVRTETRPVTLVAAIKGGPTVEFGARLVDLAVPTSVAAPRPGSWFITHGLGKPSGGTYTEVAFDQESLAEGLLGGDLPVTVVQQAVEEVVRAVAVSLYGTAWAFLYPPEQYADAIERHGVRLRERVLVDGVEVYS